MELLKFLSLLIGFQVLGSNSVVITQRNGIWADYFTLYNQNIDKFLSLNLVHFFNTSNVKNLSAPFVRFQEEILESRLDRLFRKNIHGGAKIAVLLRVIDDDTDISGVSKDTSEVQQEFSEAILRFEVEKYKTIVDPCGEDTVVYLNSFAFDSSLGATHFVVGKTFGFGVEISIKILDSGESVKSELNLLLKTLTTFFSTTVSGSYDNQNKDKSLEKHHNVSVKIVSNSWIPTPLPTTVKDLETYIPRLSEWVMDVEKPGSVLNLQLENLQILTSCRLVDKEQNVLELVPESSWQVLYSAVKEFKALQNRITSFHVGILNYRQCFQQKYIRKIQVQKLDLDMKLLTIKNNLREAVQKYQNNSFTDLDLLTSLKGIHEQYQNLTDDAVNFGYDQQQNALRHLYRTLNGIGIRCWVFEDMGLPEYPIANLNGASLNILFINSSDFFSSSSNPVVNDLISFCSNPGNVNANCYLVLCDVNPEICRQYTKPELKNVDLFKVGESLSRSQKAVLYNYNTTIWHEIVLKTIIDRLSTLTDIIQQHHASERRMFNITQVKTALSTSKSTDWNDVEIFMGKKIKINLGF